MPKFNKTNGFSLKSGNKPSFLQMRSPFTSAAATTTPDPAVTTPDPDATTEDKTEKEEKVVKPKDKIGVKIAKIMANAAIGGFDAATGSTTKRPTINFGPDKAVEEGEALNPGQKMFSEVYNPKKEDGTWKTAEEFMAESAEFNKKKDDK